MKGGAGTHRFPRRLPFSCWPYRGRSAAAPPKDHVRKLVSLPPALADRVVDYRFRHRLASETAAIRELIEKALDADDREDRRKEQGR